MDDRPTGRVADVERLLQLLALLRNSGGEWVAHATLRSNVTGYRDSAGDEAVQRMMQRDMESLRGLGFAIEGQTHEGSPARYRLKPTAWRVPLDLDRDEERLLAWVMAAAGATSESSDGLPSSLPTIGRDDGLGSLLGAMPRALDTVHTALAEHRRAVIHHDGSDKEIEPVQLSVQQGRWFVIARYVGAANFYGFRLDRLDVVGLGEPMAEEVIPPDPLTVVDNTAWQRHDPIDVELRCDAADEERVVSWFRRADVSRDGNEIVMRLRVSNSEGLIDRVLRFGSAVRITSPPALAVQIRDRALAFLEAAS